MSQEQLNELKLSVYGLMKSGLTEDGEVAVGCGNRLEPLLAHLS